MITKATTMHRSKDLSATRIFGICLHSVAGVSTEQPTNIEYSYLPACEVHVDISELRAAYETVFVGVLEKRHDNDEIV